MTEKVKNRICYTGFILVIVGHSSFSNYELVGNIVAMTGAAMIIAKIILGRVRKAS